jgi:hypothetical protein
MAQERLSWRRARRDDLPVALLWGASAALALAAAPFAASLARALPPCALHQWFGIPCATCGSTRAVLALTHGDVWRALAWNPLAALGTLALMLGLLAPGWVALGAPLPRLPGEWPRTWRVAAWLLLAAQWVYLIATRR